MPPRGLTSRQVNAHSARATRGDEAKDALVRVEALREDLALLNLRRTIEPEVPVATVAKEDFENVEDLRHLRKEEDPVATLLERAEHLKELLELAAIVLEERGVREGDLVRDS